MVRDITNDRILGESVAFYRPKLITRLKLGSLPSCSGVLWEMQDPSWENPLGFQKGRNKGRNSVKAKELV